MAREPELTLYRSCSLVSEAAYERDGERTLTQALVEAVAEAEGVAPSELPPLYESVDLDALTKLLAKPSESANGELMLGLRMNNWNVFVSSEGRIRVCDAADETGLEPIFG